MFIINYNVTKIKRRDIMTNSVKNPEALCVFSKEKMLEQLEYSVSLSESIIKALNSYLEQKRMIFTRYSLILLNNILI